MSIIYCLFSILKSILYSISVLLCTGSVHPGHDLPRCSLFRCRETTDPGCSSGRSNPGPGKQPPPPVFDISTRNHFAPLCETERDTVIVGDSIVWHVRAMLTEGKVHTHCFPGARVLDVSAQKPTILKDDAHINVKIIYSAFSCSRCDSRGG